MNAKWKIAQAMKLHFFVGIISATAADKEREREQQGDCEAEIMPVDAV